MRTAVEQPRFLAVDFYCGAGGTTRGMLDAGGYVIAGIDFDKGCCETYERNNVNELLDREPPQFIARDMFPESAAYPSGEQALVLDELHELIPYYRELAGNVPLMFAICAPCQSFTRFVQRRMTPTRTDSRARDRDLLSQTLRFIDEFQPELVMCENVVSIRRATRAVSGSASRKNSEHAATRPAMRTFARRSLACRNTDDAQSSWERVSRHRS